MDKSKARIGVWSCLALLVFLLFAWLAWFPNHYFLAAAGMIFCALFAWFFYLEFRKPSAKEVSLIAGLSSLAIAGRVLFFFVPQVKPVAAIVFISGYCLGSGPGFTIGILSMFLSNFIFGQTINTPFQMLGMGMVGFCAGLIPPQKSQTSLGGLACLSFLFTFVLYGLFVDTGSVLYLYRFQGQTSIFTVYLAGIPFNFVHALSTACFFLVFYPFLGRQLRRIRQKYGLFEARMIKCK